MTAPLARPSRLLLALAATLALLAAACGGGIEETPGAGGEPEEDVGDAGDDEADADAIDGATEGGGGGVAGEVDLEGVDVTVGSKEFTEQVILGQIAVQALEAAGASVTDQTGLVGTPVVRGALEEGEVDMYWEYTGTGWINILGETEPLDTEEAQYEAVRDADEANDITWLPPAEANNTYAIAANQSAVEEYGVETISDYAELVNSNPEAAGLCTATEFISRDDGLPGLEETYGFEVPEAQVAQLDFGLVYASVAQGDPCDFAVVFATDGPILANDLTVLEDDQAFFPKYNVAMTMRTEVYEENADAYDTLFGAISEALTQDALTELNAAVDVEAQSEEETARMFLVDNGIIGE